MELRSPSEKRRSGVVMVVRMWREAVEGVLVVGRGMLVRDLIMRVERAASSVRR